MQTTEFPRLAARFLLGNSHDVIEGPFATFLVLTVVTVPPQEYGETIAAVVRVLDGYLTADDLEWAGSPLVQKLGADTVFFYREDDLLAARAR